MSAAPHLPPHCFCPWCAGQLTQDDPYRQSCRSCGFILYHSSSPTMGAIPVDGSGRVLLARRAIEPFRGDWNTIGGFLGYGEDPYEGLRREVREETGADCVIKDFVTIASGTYGPEGTALLNAYFTVRLLSDKVSPRDDVSELRWFSLEELPENIPFESDRTALAILGRRLHNALNTQD